MMTLSGLHAHEVKEVQLVLTRTFLEDVQAGTVFNETGNISLFRQGRHCTVIKIVHFFFFLTTNYGRDLSFLLPLEDGLSLLSRS